MAFSRRDMAAELKQIVNAAQDTPIDLNLSDIHTLDRGPKVLTTWAQVAQEVTEQ